MIIEGKHSVREALTAGKSISRIVVANDNNDKEISYIISLAKSHGVTVTYADRQAIERDSVSKRHQGILGYTDDFEYSSVDDLIAYAGDRGEDIFLLILDGITDTHNLGSVLRVAECAGVHGIIIPERRSAQVNETVIRISAGAAEHMRVARVTNINDTIEYLKSVGVWVYGADMDGEDIYTTDLTGNIALVIGGEDKGVGRLTRQRCDKIIALPLKGQVNSLNASVATGIVVYEALRQRI